MSPLLGIGFWHFFITTLIGIAPQTMISVQTGAWIRSVLQVMDAEGDGKMQQQNQSLQEMVMNGKTFFILLCLAVSMLLPIVFKQLLKKQKKD